MTDAASEAGAGQRLTEQSGAALRLRLLRLWTAVAAVAMCVVTWPLWWPDGQFPLAPLSGVVARWPLSVDRCLSFALLVASATAAWLAARGAGGQAGDKRSERLVWSAVALLLALLMLLNQHRIQAWAYQFLLLSLLFAAAAPMRGLTLARWLFASVYIHSALGKFDHTFLTTIGPEFLQAAAEWAPGDAFADWNAEHRRRVSWGLPAAELTAGVLLLLPGRVRSLGVAGAAAMHLALLAILGPWQLNHHWGVLAWNVYFLIANPILFWPRRGDAVGRLPVASRSEELSSAPRSRRPSSFGDWLVTSIVVASLILPFGTRGGWWDHWPSWGLYSPSNPRVLVWVATSETERLPPRMQEHLRSGPEPQWRRLSLSSLSLAAVRAPVYPQDRFQLAVALEIIATHNLRRSSRFALQGPPDRRTGQRPTEYGSFEQAQRWRNRFRLNATARSHGTPPQKLRTPGGVTRLRRSAVPGADLWSPCGAASMRTTNG